MLIKLFCYKIIFGKKLDVCSIKTFVDGDIFISNTGALTFMGSVHARKYAFFNIQGGKVKVGDNVFFNRSLSLNSRSEITIGDGCMFGENVKIYDHDHEFSTRGVSRNTFRVSSVNIGKNSWIGSNVIILKGVTIGQNCVVGAGSVVTKDIPANVVFFQKCENRVVNII